MLRTRWTNRGLFGGGVCHYSQRTFWTVAFYTQLLWVYCPGHAGVNGNDRADRLAGKAAFTRGLLLGRSEVLRSLRHYLRTQSRGHHTIDRLEEREVERGSARRHSLKGRERAIVSQTNIRTVSKATLERRDAAHMGFSKLVDTILN